MPPKAKTQKANCSCCQKRVDAKQLKKLSTCLPFDGLMLHPDAATMLDSFLLLVSRYPNFYQWACDNCLNEKRAILANPKRQVYTFKYPWDVAQPFLAYFDQTKHCELCTESFVFSKEEQQYWYEKLQFLVYARPKKCPTCRKAVRTTRNLNTTLSDLLKNGQPTDKESLLKIAAVYDAMDKTEKAKKYRTFAAKIRS